VTDNLTDKTNRTTHTDKFTDRCMLLSFVFAADVNTIETVRLLVKFVEPQ